MEKWREHALCGHFDQPKSCFQGFLQVSKFEISNFKKCCSFSCIHMFVLPENRRLCNKRIQSLIYWLVMERLSPMIDRLSGNDASNRFQKNNRNRWHSRFRIFGSVSSIRIRNYFNQSQNGRCKQQFIHILEIQSQRCGTFLDFTKLRKNLQRKQL